MGTMDIRKQRLITACKVALGKNFRPDFIYEDVDFTKLSTIKEAYEVFEAGDWVIYNKKTGKRLSPSKSWRKWQGAKAAASKIGGDAEVADAAWYQDNKDKLMGEATDLEEATFYKPKVNRESETITFVNDAEAKQAERLFTSMKLKVKRSGKRISFINTAEFKSAKSKVMAESTDLEEAKNATVRELRQMLFKTGSDDADAFRRVLLNVKKQDSPATNAQIKKAKKIIGNRFGKDAFVQLEAKGDKQPEVDTIGEATDKELDIKSLKDLIKNPSPKMIKQYGGKDKYIKMLKSKLAKLESIEENIGVEDGRRVIVKALTKPAALRLQKKLRNKFNSYDFNIDKSGLSIIVPNEKHIIRFINKQPEVDTIGESVDLEEKKVIAQVELWNGKKMKKSFKDQSSAEKFIKKTQDEEDVRGYNMYAEGLEEAIKWWTVTITKKTGKLFKGQTVDVKASNSAQAIKKGLKQMKADPMTVPSGSVDAVLGESKGIDFEKTNVLTYDEYDEVQNFQNFNKNDWKRNVIQRKYIRKKKV